MSLTSSILAEDDLKETPNKKLKHAVLDSIFSVNNFGCGECSSISDDTNLINVQNNLIFEKSQSLSEEISNDNQNFEVGKSHVNTKPVDKFYPSKSNEQHKPLDHFYKSKTDRPNSFESPDSHTSRHMIDMDQPGCSGIRERGNGLIRHIIEGSAVEERLCFENILQNRLTSPVGTETDKHTVIKDKSEDVFNKYLVAWQNRQMGRSFADNTINSILNDLGPRYIHDRAQLQEFPEFNITYDSDSTRRRTPGDGVEDEAILMAINTHGLHNKSSEDTYLYEQKKCTCLYSQSSTSASPCESQQSTSKPFHSRNDSSKFATYYNVQQSSLESKDDINELNISISPVCSLACDSQSATPPAPVRMDEELLFESSLPEHTDFMDKAVNFAIQEKGLSTVNFNKNL